VAELSFRYSRADREPVSTIASRLEQTGHQVWWDARLLAHQDFGVEIETALERAHCAVVAAAS